MKILYKVLIWSIFYFISQNVYADLSTGLIAYYPFNGNAQDASGNANHGTLFGPTLTSDKQNNSNSAYLFDGIDDYIEIADSDSLDMGTSDYSIVAWVKISTPTNNGRIFSKGSSACVTGYMLRLNANQAHLENAFENSCKIIFAGNQDIADNEWHFVVGVVKRSEGGFIYVDGELDNSQLQDTSAYDFSNQRNAWIGRNDVHQDEAFNGVIDELRIYNRALSESEIRQLYLLQGGANTVNAEISTSNGEVIIASPVNVEVTAEDSSQSTAFAIVTPGTTITQVTVENTAVQVEADSLMLVHPSQNVVTMTEEFPATTLIRGSLQPKVNCTDNNEFVVHTVLADIKALCDNSRNVSDGAEFTTSYQQDGQNGQLTISVITGSVSVTDRNGEQVVLSAGSSQTTITINANVLRSTWVLPIDNDRVYGGQDNLLVWTAYPRAAGYILEYTLPLPSFAESNAQSVEFKERAIRLKPGDYELFDDLVLFRTFIGTSTGTPLVEGRVFALDEAGNIISESVSSDKVSIIWQ